MSVEQTTDSPINDADKSDSGLLVISDNSDAFAARVLLARAAVETLDLQYYIWHDDHCGQLLAREVVAAADRGVRVRMLIDDINPQASDANYQLADGHPNIELKLFNPSGLRQRGIARGLEMLARFRVMNRRMHCKAWIADGRLAIVGGRNIGDEYFDAAETNFRDIDLLMDGGVARQCCINFERYWNYAGSVPVRALNAAPRRRSIPWRDLPGIDIDTALGASATIEDFIAAHGPMYAAGSARLIADPPEKIEDKRRENWVMAQVVPIIAASSQRLEIVSPYFVPGKEGVAILAKLVERGVKASVLTNSLSATDVAAVHGGYSNYRRKLLRAGVKLFELKRTAVGPKKMSVFGSKGASLHSKSFTVDDRYGFVGSLNFDPRSASLNTEMGVLFECPSLVSELHALFDEEKLPESSYSLKLEYGRIHWEGVENGEMQRQSSEPAASLRRRLLAFAVRWLPMESQL